MKQVFFPVWDGNLMHIGQSYADDKGDYLGGWSTACGMPYPTRLGFELPTATPTCLGCIAAAPRATFIR